MGRVGWEPGWEFSHETGEPPIVCDKCHRIVYDHSESGPWFIRIRIRNNFIIPKGNSCGSKFQKHKNDKIQAKDILTNMTHLNRGKIATGLPTFQKTLEWDLVGSTKILPHTQQIFVWPIQHHYYTAKTFFIPFTTSVVLNVGSRVLELLQVYNSELN